MTLTLAGVDVVIEDPAQLGSVTYGPPSLPDVVVVPVAGPAGPAAAAITATAATTLSGHRVVVVDATGARYADPADPADAWAAVALTLGAATAGQPVTVADDGPIDEPSWTFTTGLPVFVGPAGTLTQTPPTAPTAAWLRVIGVAVTPTRLWLAFTPPIRLT